MSNSTERKKGLTILLRSGAMANMDPNIATGLAKAARKKGYPVHLFCFGEGVTSVKDGQEPKRFPNTGKEIGELVDMGVRIGACGSCTRARGLKEEEAVPGAKVGSLALDLSTFLNNSDRLVTLGR